MFKIAFNPGASDVALAQSFCSKNRLQKKSSGFTLAEVLITVMIIGIVAAMSIPALVENVSERVWDSQRKVLHYRLSEALTMLPRLSGYEAIKAEGGAPGYSEAAVFILNGLSSVYKISHSCYDNDNLSACGLPPSFINQSGNSITFPTTLSSLDSGITGTFTINGVSHTVSNTDAAAFKTTNGESIAVYYNPDCISYRDPGLNSTGYMQPFVCVNFIYDLNGEDGPNTIGRDMGFITALYAKNPVIVAPNVYVNEVAYDTYNNAIALCNDIDGDLRLPSKEELMSVAYNEKLVGDKINAYNGFNAEAFLPTGVTVLRAWHVGFNSGYGSISYYNTYANEANQYWLCIYQ